MSVKVKCKRRKKQIILWLAMTVFLICGIKTDANQIMAGTDAPMLFAEMVEKEVMVNARKRVQWVDEATGNAKITLQYASNSGELSVTQDMNVVLIHDKSGSMDVNYGYHLEKVKKGWINGKKSIDYPLLNDKQWSETIMEENSEIDLESEGKETYLKRLNSPNEYTVKKGASKGYVMKDGVSSFADYYFEFNSSCQVDGHYYLLVNEDSRSGISAWRMVHGKNLYNVENTDLHHYVLIEAKNGKSARDHAVELIGQGHRVVRMTTDSEYYYTENGETKITENLYFLDISKLEEYEEGWIINACGSQECLDNGRLNKTQQFMASLVQNILNLNPSNKIAYIPFWGSVPENNTWKNYNGNAAGNNIVDVSGYESLITSCEGVDALDFTSDMLLLQNQINHPFTYNGTNWSLAFEKAIEYLGKRNAEDQKKETLVLFLTDGMPQGTEGSSNDYQNPYISGIQTDAAGKLYDGSAYRLQKIPGVTVWSVGIGINEQDTTGLKTRLRLINEDGQPFYARYTADFESLRKDVFAKIEKTYVESFYATDAFFKDTLSEFFVLDKTKLDSSWMIVNTEPGSVKVHGVPENIYKLVNKDGKDTGIFKIYDENTKTIYWYLGVLQNGTYEEAGHTLEIPVKFLAYNEDTAGIDKIITGNLEQSLTYHTTLEPEVLYTVNIDTPKLVFSRKNSEITVEKNVSNKTKADRTYYFVYSKEKYVTGKIENVLGKFQITIPEGSTTGTNVLKNLEDGTYYIYETDKNNFMINPQVCEAKVDYQPMISTKSKSSQIPWSVTTSDGASLKNKDNYLKLASQDRVEFEAGGVLTISKQIDIETEGIHWEHGNPTFMIRLSGNGIDGKNYIFGHTFEFTPQYVTQNAVNGKVIMSHTFYDIPISEKYLVEEVKMSRFRLEEISCANADADAVQVLQTQGGNDGYYELKAEVNLKKKPQGISLIFYNRKIDEGWFNHVTSVKNEIINVEK